MKGSGSTADNQRVTGNPHSRQREHGTFLGSGRAWAVAAFFVLAISIAIALWFDQTGANVDEYRLERGAEAISRNLESEIRVIEMSSNVVVAAAVATENPEDFAAIAVTADPEVLGALVALVSYPVTDDGTGPGRSFFLVAPAEDVSIPDLGLPGIVTDALVREDVPFLSPAYTEPGLDGVRMVVVVPAQQFGETVLVGAIFRADVILNNAMAAVSDDEYAAELLDRRFNDSTITASGTLGVRGRAAVPGWHGRDGRHRGLSRGGVPVLPFPDCSPHRAGPRTRHRIAPPPTRFADQGPHARNERAA